MLYSGRIRVYINNIKDRYKAMTYYDFVAKLRINNRFIDNLSLHSSEKTKKTGKWTLPGIEGYFINSSKLFRCKTYQPGERI